MVGIVDRRTSPVEWPPVVEYEGLNSRYAMDRAFGSTRAERDAARSYNEPYNRVSTALGRMLPSGVVNAAQVRVSRLRGGLFPFFHV